MISGKSGAERAPRRVHDTLRRLLPRHHGPFGRAREGVALSAMTDSPTTSISSRDARRIVSRCRGGGVDIGTDTVRAHHRLPTALRATTNADGDIPRGRVHSPPDGDVLRVRGRDSCPHRRQTSPTARKCPRRRRARDTRTDAVSSRDRHQRSHPPAQVGSVPRSALLRRDRGRCRIIRRPDAPWATAHAGWSHDRDHDLPPHASGPRLRR